MTLASAQGRGSRTFLERLGWRIACKRSAERRVRLIQQIRENEVATLPDSATLDFLQREDVLYLTSMQSLTVRMIAPSLSACATGITLAASMNYAHTGIWSGFLLVGLLLAPIGITGALMFAADSPSMRRWTTEFVTATARRSYESLLPSFAVTGRIPPKKNPFHPPQVPAVQALEDFALALEKYALDRAVVGGGRHPMPEVVSRYHSAAAFVRKLRDDLEISRDEGRLRAIIEMQRILEVLASGRIIDFAPATSSSDSLLNRHREHRARRRQLLSLTVFTSCIAVLIVALVSAGKEPASVAVAVAGATVAALMGSWMKVFRLPSAQGDGTSPTTTS